MPAPDTTSSSRSLPSVVAGSGFFRGEAIEYHYGDPESVGVADTSLRWTWFTLLVSTLLVVAALFFLYFTQIEVATRLTGFVQVGDPACALQTVGDMPRVIVSLADARAASLHGGDDVRLETRDASHDRPIFFDGRLSKIIPAVDDPTGKHRNGGAPSAPARMEIEFIARDAQRDSLAELRNGAAVIVHATAAKQRLMEYVLASLKGSIR